jgi:hypothetical protein
VASVKWASIRHALYLKCSLFGGRSVIYLDIEVVTCPCEPEDPSSRVGSHGLLCNLDEASQFLKGSFKMFIVLADIFRRAIPVELEFFEGLLLHVRIWACSESLLSLSVLRGREDCTIKARIVFQCSSMHFVIAPSAPSPNEPSSTIFFCSLGAPQPSIVQIFHVNQSAFLETASFKTD